MKIMMSIHSKTGLSRHVLKIQILDIVYYISPLDHQVSDNTKQLLFCFNKLCFLLIQANTERKLRQVEEQLNESNSKLADHEATIVALTSSQAKLQSEANELGSQLSEAESKIGTLSKAKSGLEAQVEDLKSELESESAVSQQYALVEN